MVVLRLVHTSKYVNRASIQKLGLIPHKPTEDGNYTDETWQEDLIDQPRGVYACLADNDDKDLWKAKIAEDVWSFSWVGHMRVDPWFDDGVKVVVERKVPSKLLQLEKEAPLFKLRSA